MKTNTIKTKIKESIKQLILNDILNNKNPIFFSCNKKIHATINTYITEMKLSKKDYFEIKNDVLNEILIKKTYSFSNESKSIINIFSKKINNYTLEYILTDSDPTIYFHLEDKTSYLINYDILEDTWYLSLVNTDTSTLIKEIYCEKYSNFLLYIKKIKKPLNKFNG